MNETMFKGKRPSIGDAFKSKGSRWIVSAIGPGVVIGTMDHIQGAVRTHKSLITVKEEFK